MFKTAAAKIAHNSTLPALGGNQDLRPLQDLITAEKAVLISLQKLSVDYAKASEALRTWGLNEGDDLGDILSASTTLLNHFSSALSQYATHGHAMRDQLKAIRTREEALEELKRRRRTVVRKAEDADKKLSKMSPEHKNLGMQTETLNRLRDEIRTMDSDIMTEEAALGDFKRSATRGWMGLKFGGLLECCEKGSIAAEFGKMIISEISEEMTQPGLPRSLYYGQAKTENLVAEASRCIGDVVLSTVPSIGSRDRRQYDQSQSEYPPNSDAYSSETWNGGKPQPPPPMQLNNNEFQQRSFGDSMGSPTATTGPSFADQPYSPIEQPPYSGSTFSPRIPPEIQEETPEKPTHSMDDFGMNTRTPGLIDSSNASGGRFATFPVKTRATGANGGYSLQDPPSIGSRQQDQSFSASIAEALDDRDSQETSQATEGPHIHTQQPPFAVRNPAGGQVPWTGRGGVSYEFSDPPAMNNELPPIPGSTSSALPPPPPGAALPSLASPWGDSDREGPSQAPTHSHLSVNEDALLAYMTSAQEDLHADEPPSPVASTLAAPSQSEEEQHRISRHVRFGEVEDVEEQMKKKSLDKERHQQGPVLDEKKTTDSVPPQNSTGVEEGNRSESSSPNSKPPLHRVPPPTIFTEVDEKALDAAAARDVARELGALKTNRPSPPDVEIPDVEIRSETEPPSTPERGRLPTTLVRGQSDQTVERDRSPLLPPHAPFAARSVSPHPYAELNPNAPVPGPSPYGGQYSPGQSYQDLGSYGSPPNVSAGQPYPQPYQGSPTYSQPTTPDGHATSSSLPPRFQALNRSSENQVPPRFQSTQSPAHQHQVPPRFQTGNSSQVPSSITLPEQQDPARFASSLKSSEGSTPYRTPPEYPRTLGVSPAFTRSSSSLNASTTNSPSSPPISGPRTISAAAFKRPRNTSTDNMGTSGEFVKKSLPSSPYPLRDQGERNVEPSSVPNTKPTSYSSSSGPPTLPPIENTQEVELEDDYDYISAYVNSSNPNSPTQGQFSNTGTTSASHPARIGGYGEGRFATDLDAEALR